MCRAARLLTAAALAGMAGLAVAGPVEADAVAADPYDLAVRWTLASLAPRDQAPSAEVPAPPPARPSAVPLAGGDAAGVPDPSGYALMGLLLVGAGLLAQRLTARRGRRAAHP